MTWRSATCRSARPRCMTAGTTWAATRSTTTSSSRRCGWSGPAAWSPCSPRATRWMPATRPRAVRWPPSPIWWGRSGCRAGPTRRPPGTGVVTDLLILRRREPGRQPDPGAWEQARPVVLDGHQVSVNEHFLARPEAVLGGLSAVHGAYSAADLVVTPTPGVPLDEALTARRDLPPGRSAARSTARAARSISRCYITMGCGRGRAVRRPGGRRARGGPGHAVFPGVGIRPGPASPSAPGPAPRRPPTCRRAGRMQPAIWADPPGRAPRVVNRTIHDMITSGARTGRRAAR